MNTRYKINLRIRNIYTKSIGFYFPLIIDSPPTTIIKRKVKLLLLILSHLNFILQRM